VASRASRTTPSEEKIVPEDSEAAEVALAVVVGIDGTPGGWDALAWAAAEARSSGGSLRIVHVVERPVTLDVWPGSPVDGSEALQAGADLVQEGVRRAREVVAGLEVDTQVEAWVEVSAVLVRAAATGSLLVVGKRRGNRPWWRRGRRRIAVRAARRAPCPVAVVELSSRPGSLTGWVVVLDDSSGQDSPAVAFGRAAASHRRVDMAVVPSADWLLFGHRGAALVVVGGRGSGRGLRLPPVAVRALATATEPTVVVAG
jgi:nucleotide-binding universal stress UspA family protein